MDRAGADRMTLICEVVEDRILQDAWRVEAIDYENEGVAYITVFIGPDAEKRAKYFSGTQGSIF